MGVGVAAFKKVKLLKNLACVANKFGTFVCEGNTAVGAVKDRNAELLFGIFNGCRKGWLGNIELLTCCINRSTFGIFNDVAKLLERNISVHSFVPLSIVFFRIEVFTKTRESSIGARLVKLNLSKLYINLST